MQDPAREVETQAFAQVLREELERRLTTFAGYSDETFGSISLLELTLTALLYGGVPLALVWLFA